jgi:hypothetical protein
VAAIIKRGDPLRHGLKTLARRSFLIERGEDQFTLPGLERLHHGFRHILLTAWKLVVEACFAQAAGFGQKRDRRPFFAMAPEYRREFFDQFFTGLGWIGHRFPCLIGRSGRAFPETSERVYRRGLRGSS